LRDSPDKGRKRQNLQWFRQRDRAKSARIILGTRATLSFEGRYTRHSRHGEQVRMSSGTSTRAHPRKRTAKSNIQRHVAGVQFHSERPIKGLRLGRVARGEHLAGRVRQRKTEVCDFRLEGRRSREPIPVPQRKADQGLRLSRVEGVLACIAACEDRFHSEGPIKRLRVIGLRRH
jgi:hypothetical protein